MWHRHGLKACLRHDGKAALASCRMAGGDCARKRSQEYGCTRLTWVCLIGFPKMWEFANRAGGGLSIVGRIRASMLCSMSRWQIARVGRSRRSGQREGHPHIGRATSLNDSMRIVARAAASSFRSWNLCLRAIVEDESTIVAKTALSSNGTPNSQGSGLCACGVCRCRRGDIELLHGVRVRLTSR